MEPYNNGEYEFILSSEDSLCIKISFSINSNGELSYYDPIILN